MRQLRHIFLNDSSVFSDNETAELAPNKRITVYFVSVDIASIWNMTCVRRFYSHCGLCVFNDCWWPPQILFRIGRCHSETTHMHAHAHTHINTHIWSYSHTTDTTTQIIMINAILCIRRFFAEIPLLSSSITVIKNYLLVRICHHCVRQGDEPFWIMIFFLYLFKIEYD